jgi:uracil-DNA glycosylase
MDHLLAKLICQHAETSRLLGVDFVPAYRTSPDSPATVGTDEADEPPVPPLVTIVAAVPSRQEAAPGTPAASTAAVEASRAPASTTLLEIRPCSRAAADVQRALDEVRACYEKEAPHRQFVTAHNTIVFGEGDPCARLMFIGEAPGAEEDKTGRPFVGRAGQLLEKMIGAMGLQREQVYIANVLKTRPPDNATPTSEEIRICAPYLFQQIAIVQPEVIVTLGLPATRALLNTTEAMSRLRGRWASFQPPAPCPNPVAVMPTYHPAFLLRSYTPENRAKVWSDLQQVMVRLGMAAAEAARSG